jgi:hypothetical protein
MRLAVVGGGGGAPGDPPGFAFLAGRVKDGIAQYVRIGSATGLRLLNARHAVTAALVPNAIDLVTSQSYDLPAGTTRISLQLMGGGGAGQSVNSSGTRFTGGAGGLTRVELWDGGSFTGLAWEAAGALGGGTPNPRTITAGESSPWGTGGAAAWMETKWIAGSEGGSYEYIYHPAQHGTGFGAGGGGGRSSWSGSIVGYGGSAAPLIEVEQVDVTHLVLPRLVITVGAAGLLPSLRAAERAGARGQRRAGPGPALGRVHHRAARRRGAAGAHRHRQLCQARQFLRRLPRSRVRALGAAHRQRQYHAPAQHRRDRRLRHHAVSRQRQCRELRERQDPALDRLGAARTIHYAFHSMGSWGGA